MKVTPLSLNGALILEPEVHQDLRGYFMESYNEALFRKHGVNNQFIQDNHSLSIEAHVLRGLHYQILPKTQAKLVRVLSGAIFDVIVDLRKKSPTFGQWESVILSEQNRRQLLVPRGFAHGFCTLVPNTQVFYKVDEYYSPNHDCGILWSDPSIGIVWPTSNPILSVKDQQHPLLQDAHMIFE